jgi:hypothetical protein
MTPHSTDETSGTLGAHEVVAQAKQRLRRFFQNDYVKDLVSVLVPSALAAVLFPVFGPVVATPAAAVAVHNGLKAFGIAFSADSLEKMLKPLEGRQIDESDVKAVLKDLLPTDEQVNDEAAQALVKVVPEVKEAALSNPRLDPDWLGQSLATNLKEQGGTMAQVAPKVNELVHMDDAQLRAAISETLAKWSSIKQTITASRGGTVSKSPQSVKEHAGSGEISQNIAATDHGQVTESGQSVERT